jgi:transposase
MSERGNDWVEQPRILRGARRSAMQARTQTINQMHAVVVGAPHDLNDQLQRLSAHQLITHAARFRVGDLDDARSVARWTLHLLTVAAGAPGRSHERCSA